MYPVIIYVVSHIVLTEAAWSADKSSDLPSILRYDFLSYKLFFYSKYVIHLLNFLYSDIKLSFWRRLIQSKNGQDHRAHLFHHGLSCLFHKNLIKFSLSDFSYVYDTLPPPQLLVYQTESFLFQQYFIHCSILNEIRQQTRSILAVSLHQRQNEQIEILWNH